MKKRKERQRQPVRPRAGLLLGLLAGTLAFMAMLRTCSAPNPHHTPAPLPSGGDTTDVAIQYSPLALYRYSDTLGGFGYDFIRELAARERMAVKFHPIVSLDGVEASLAEGIYDIVVANLPRTDQYSPSLTFTEPVYLDRLVLVQRGGDSIHISSQLDLAGRSVTVPAGSPAATRLRNLAAEIGDTIIIHEDSQYGPEQLFIMAATGEIPLAAVNASTARALADDYPEADISTAVSFTQFQSWLVNGADTAFVDSLNTRIGRFKQTEAYRQLTRRYGVTPNL